MCRDFSDCAKALEHFLSGSRHLPVCAFIDLVMPKMGGTDCLLAIKADSPLMDIPVFVISSDIPDGERERLRCLGATGFVTKPDNIERLRDEIARLLPPPVGGK